MIKKGLPLLLATMLVLTAFVGCGPSEEFDGTELIWGVGTETDTMDPRATTSAYSIEVFEMVFNSLLYADRNLELEYDLATDIDVKDDDVTYVISIRDDVKWHDGEPLTAHDVVFTYETILDPDFGSPMLTRVGAIESITALDDYTVEFVTESPDASFLYNLNKFIVPEHAAPADPFADEDEDGVATGGFAHSPTGSGPYKVEEWRPNDRVVLVRNEDYFKGTPNLERIVRREIPEAEARYADLRAGDIHMGGIPVEEIDNMKEDPDFTVVQDTTLNYFPIFINHQYEGNDILNNKLVRQALNHAADYDQIVEEIFKTSTRAYSPIIAGTWAYDEDAVKIYDYNPERARELLEEAGYPDGIELELIQSSSPDHNRFGEMLEYQYAEAGIDLTVSSMDFGTMLDRTNGGEYQLSNVGMTGMTDPDAFMRRYENASGAGNYNNEEVNELIREARSIVDDQDARAAIYSEIQAILSEDAIDIPIRYSIMTIVFNADFNLDYTTNESYRHMWKAYWDLDDE